MSWTEDADRCAAAGIPAGWGSRPSRDPCWTWRARLRCPSRLGYRGRGVRAEPGFRSWLAAREVPFVLATRSDDVLTCHGGRRHQAAYLTALAGDRKGGPATGRNEPIPLSSDEIPRLLATLVLALVICMTTAINWSN